MLVPRLSIVAGIFTRRAEHMSRATLCYARLLDIAARFDIRRALLFMGGAGRGGCSASPPNDFSGSSRPGFSHAHAKIMPLHFEGWAHFSEGRDVIEKAFAGAHLSDLIWRIAGKRS